MIIFAHSNRNHVKRKDIMYVEKIRTKTEVIVDLAFCIERVCEVELHCSFEVALSGLAWTNRKTERSFFSP